MEACKWEVLQPLFHIDFQHPHRFTTATLGSSASKSITPITDSADYGHSRVTHVVVITSLVSACEQ
jgi:hypothetical protein